MAIVFVESANLSDVTNISTISQETTYIKAYLENPVIDVSKMAGYVLEEGIDGYRLRFDESKYNNCVHEKEVEEAIKTGEALRDQLQEEYILTMATDTDAYAMRYLYGEYAVGKTYHKGDRFMYQDKFYKVVSANEFVSTEDWKPDISPSLYVEISDPNIEYPEFKQPINAETAYQMGDKITYKGEKYMSTINNNAYSPDDYPAGWQKVE
jgi:hypothetical protein